MYHSHLTSSDQEPDVHWLGGVESMLGASVQRMSIQLFPRANAGFREWRVFIEVQTSIIELGSNASMNTLTCALLDHPIPASVIADRLVAEARQGYPPPTVEHILKIATRLAKSTLNLTPELSAREVQSRWSSWVVQFMMEVVENSALFVPCREFHRMRELMDWNLDNK